MGADHGTDGAVEDAGGAKALLEHGLHGRRGLGGAGVDDGDPLGAAVGSDILQDLLLGLAPGPRRRLAMDLTLGHEHDRLDPEEAAQGTLHAGESVAAVERIANSAIKEVLATDSVPLCEAGKHLKKIKVLSVANLLARGIRSIHEETSISELFI